MWDVAAYWRLRVRNPEKPSNEPWGQACIVEFYFLTNDQPERCLNSHLTRCRRLHHHAYPYHQGSSYHHYTAEHYPERHDFLGMLAHCLAVIKLTDRPGPHSAVCESKPPSPFLLSRNLGHPRPCRAHAGGSYGASGSPFIWLTRSQAYI
jgi:hypothetical protein